MGGEEGAEGAGVQGIWVEGGGGGGGGGTIEKERPEAENLGTVCVFVCE